MGEGEMGGRLCKRNKKRDRERRHVGGEMKVFSNKIFDWEATVLPNQKMYIWGIYCEVRFVSFCEIFPIFREENQYRETAASALSPCIPRRNIKHQEGPTGHSLTHARYMSRWRNTKYL
jgi:hypothetical protein